MKWHARRTDDLRGQMILVVTGEFLGMVFCDTLFCGTLLVKCTRMNRCSAFRDYPCAIPNCAVERKMIKLRGKGVAFFIT